MTLQPSSKPKPGKVYRNGTAWICSGAELVAQEKKNWVGPGLSQGAAAKQRVIVKKQDTFDSRAINQARVGNR